MKEGYFLGVVYTGWGGRVWLQLVEAGCVSFFQKILQGIIYMEFTPFLSAGVSKYVFFPDGVEKGGTTPEGEARLGLL